MTREAMLARLGEHAGPWDVVVVGGGATGAGVAVDAASRGYSVVLLEGSDFGKGTSSRSTKLVHGGVRYLSQGNIALVTGALRERAALRANAPHLVHPLQFVVPSYRWWQAPYYGTGLKVYSLLAGRHGFGPSTVLSQGEALARVPTLRRADLRGGVTYFDGQFDDARLVVNLVQTAAEHGAVTLNYARVAGVTRTPAGETDGVGPDRRRTRTRLRSGARRASPLSSGCAFPESFRGWRATYRGRWGSWWRSRRCRRPYRRRRRWRRAASCRCPGTRSACRGRCRPGRRKWGCLASFAADGGVASLRLPRTERSG